MSLMSLARALPEPVKVAIKATRDTTGLALVRLFSSSGFLASLYYCFVSREFDREHRAVLLGRLNFARRMRGKGENDAFLRRNVHRLEKGLIMRPRRATFAEDYIGPTVRCFADAAQAGVPNGQQRAAGTGGAGCRAGAIGLQAPTVPLLRQQRQGKGRKGRQVCRRYGGLS